MQTFPEVRAPEKLGRVKTVRVASAHLYFVTAASEDTTHRTKEPFLGSDNRQLPREERRSLRAGWEPGRYSEAKGLWFSVTWGSSEGSLGTGGSTSGQEEGFHKNHPRLQCQG